LIPLGDLVKKNGEPLNNSDIFGLSILTTDGDTINSETPVIWQNWNETSGLTFFDEDVIWGQAEEYFFNKTYTTDKTILDRWGEGEIGSGGSMSGELSYAMTVNVSWNDTIALSGEDYCVVNQTIWVNNTGSGALTDIWLNQTWWNCSCSDLNMTLVDTNLSMSNITWYNDSCYWYLHNESLTLDIGETWTFWMTINITACPGTVSATETITTIGNASELTSDVTSDDSISFQWGYRPIIMVTYGNADLAGVFEDNLSTIAFIAILALVLVATAIIFFVKKIGGGF